MDRYIFSGDGSDSSEHSIIPCCIAMSGKKTMQILVLLNSNGYIYIAFCHFARANGGEYLKNAEEQLL